MRLATTLTIVGALVGSIAATQVAAAAPSEGGNAVVAAKNCKKIKNKKKRKKCQQSGGVNLTNMSFNRTYVDVFREVTTTEQYNFCAGGLFRWVKTLQDNFGNSETTTYRGTWRLISSNPPQNAVVGFVYASAVSMDGTGQPLPPTPGPPFRTLTFAPGGVVYFDSDQFFQATGAAC